MSEKISPCVEKDCSWCCDPVKVQEDFPESNIPINESGEKIWIKRDELYIPEDHPETVRLQAYDCLNYDHQSKKCKTHETRPEICRNTSCIDKDSIDSIDRQHQRSISQKFFIVRKSK